MILGVNNLEQTPYSDLKIVFQALTVPGINGENAIDITLEKSEGGWSITGKFGNVYSAKPFVQKVLNAEVVEVVLSKLMQTKITPSPGWIMGVDGSTYIARVENGFNVARYEWWSYLPKEWEIIGDLVRALYEWVDYPGRIEMLDEDY